MLNSKLILPLIIVISLYLFAKVIGHAELQLASLLVLVCLGLYYFLAKKVSREQSKEKNAKLLTNLKSGELALISKARLGLKFGILCASSEELFFYTGKLPKNYSPGMALNQSQIQTLGLVLLHQYPLQQLVRFSHFSGILWHTLRLSFDSGEKVNFALSDAEGFSLFIQLLPD